MPRLRLAVEVDTPSPVPLRGHTSPNTTGGQWVVERTSLSLGRQISSDLELLNWTRWARGGLGTFVQCRLPPVSWDSSFDPRVQGGYVEVSIYPSNIQLGQEINDILHDGQ